MIHAYSLTALAERMADRLDLACADCVMHSARHCRVRGSSCAKVLCVLFNSLIADALPDSLQPRHVVGLVSLGVLLLWYG